MNFFALIGIVMRYAPLIILAVQTVESLTDAGTKGDVKKAAALKLLTDVLAQWNVILDGRQLELVSQGIDLIVGALNMFGVFKKEAQMSDDQAITRAAHAVVDTTQATAAVSAAIQSDPALEAFLEATAK